MDWHGHTGLRTWSRVKRTRQGHGHRGCTGREADTLHYVTTSDGSWSTSVVNTRHTPSSPALTTTEPCSPSDAPSTGPWWPVCSLISVPVRTSHVLSVLSAEAVTIRWLFGAGWPNTLVIASYNGQSDAALAEYDGTNLVRQRRTETHRTDVPDACFTICAAGYNGAGPTCRSREVNKSDCFDALSLDVSLEGPYHFPFTQTHDPNVPRVPSHNSQTRRRIDRQRGDNPQIETCILCRKLENRVW